MTLHRFIEFIIHHFLLFGAFVVAFVLVILEEVRSRNNTFYVSSQEATQKINRESAVVVDVRDAASFEAGHIAGSRHIPAVDFSLNHKRLASLKKIPVIVVCENAVTSLKCAEQLKNGGFSEVSVLRGGLNAWRRDKLLLVTR